MKSRNTHGSGMIDKAKKVSLYRRRSTGKKLFPCKTTLFRENDTFTGMYYLTAGRVKIFKEFGEEKENILRFAKAGDLLGFSGLASGFYTNTVVAIEAVTALFIPAAELTTLFHDSNGVSGDVIRNLCRRIADTEERILSLARNSARGRLAEALLTLKDTFDVDERQFLKMTLRRRDLANYAGTTTETVSRMLDDFHKKRLIERQGKKIRLLSIDRLREISKVRD